MPWWVHQTVTLCMYVNQYAFVVNVISKHLVLTTRCTFRCNSFGYSFLGGKAYLLLQSLCFDILELSTVCKLLLLLCFHGIIWLSHILQDNTLRIWDMRPYAPSNRCMKIFTGHQHNYEKNLLKCDWSPDGSKVGLSFWIIFLSMSACNATWQAFTIWVTRCRGSSKA